MASTDLLPPNATPLCRQLASQGQRITDLDLPIRATWSPQDCPAPVLPWLAFAFAVENWDSSWSIEQQRTAIENSIPVHKRKGTIGALREAVASMGMDISVSEWWQRLPMGTPFTFRLRVVIDQYGLTQEGLHLLLAIVEGAKNLRSWMDGLEMEIRSSADVRIGAYVCTGRELSIPFGGDELISDGFALSDGGNTAYGYKASTTS